MITQILVPTDFSESSEKAFEWACYFAGVTSASVHLFHRIETPNAFEKKEVEDQLSALSVKGEHLGISITSSHASGRLIEDIAELIHHGSFDLVIMGAHGKSGYQASMLGSNTVKAVRKLHANLLIVKKESTPVPVRRIMFTSALNETDRPSFRWLLKLSQLFEVEKLHVMSVNTGSYFSQPTIVMEEALKGFSKIAQKEAGIRVKAHFYKNASVLSGIQEFSREEEVDFIAIPNHEKHPLKRIFLGSTVETLVQISSCPVLCINLQ
jgi:nucleotide-binding universal stress UspA family protein